SLLPENIQHLQARKRSGRFGPNQLSALAAAELPLPLRSCQEHSGLLLIGGLATPDQAVALSNQQVTDVERDRNPMFLVQRFLTISFFVAIFDVVVNERSFVKTLHGNGDFSNVFRQSSPRHIAQCLVGCDGQKWPPPFAGPSQPFTSNFFRSTLRGSDNFLNRCRCEPGINFLAERAQIQPARLVITGKVDVIPNPIDIDGGIDAVV